MNTKILGQDLLRRSSLLKAAMYRSLEITQAGGKCWAQNVVNIFNNAGYPEFFLGSSGCDKTMRNVIMCS